MFLCWNYILLQLSSSDSTKSRDLVSESTDVLIVRKNDTSLTEDREQNFPIERSTTTNGRSVSPSTEKDQRSSSHDCSQKSKNVYDLSSSSASFPIAPPFTPSASVLQSDQEMCYSSDQGGGSVEKSSKANLKNHAYQIVKELLMTERTYNNDLKLCLEFESTTNSIVSSLEGMPSFDGIFSYLKSVRDLQAKFLLELEQRISSWESKVVSISKIPEYQTFKVGDVLLREIHNSNQAYEKYISHIYEYHEKVLLDLHVKNAQFQTLCKEFESRPQCYIPVAKLLLKPLNRVFSRQIALSKLVLYYIDQGGHNPDLSECKVALDKINALIKNTASYREKLENITKLIEIEHDFVGLNIENLYRPVKILLRQGGLLKVTKRDLSPRLILLFEDAIIHASQTNDGHAMRITFTFRSALNLKGLTIEDGNAIKGKLSPQNKNRLNNNEMYTNNCFTLHTGNRSLVLCASTSEQKQSWMEDISRAVMRVKENVTLQTFVGGSVGANLSSSNGFPSVAKTSSSSVEDLGQSTSTNENVSSPAPCSLQKSSMLSSSRATISSTSAASTLERFWHHRANDSLHICIHRMVSLTGEHYEKMAHCELSGYLLRKFRNSLGWQQLWVVYCNFCLFFYKSHEDDSPLAGLPLLGYSLADTPDAQSNIRKEFVFKLHYRTHYYYFRTNSEYSFKR
uniref:Uncharacterized protein n=1 Tax=Romanomermis culicivorax TaxID=13658 RepID=A0A915IBN0_ROMCU